MEWSSPPCRFFRQPSSFPRQFLSFFIVAMDLLGHYRRLVPGFFTAFTITGCVSPVVSAPTAFFPLSSSLSTTPRLRTLTSSEGTDLLSPSSFAPQSRHFLPGPDRSNVSLRSPASTPPGDPPRVPLSSSVSLLLRVSSPTV